MTVPALVYSMRGVRARVGISFEIRGKVIVGVRTTIKELGLRLGPDSRLGLGSVFELGPELRLGSQLEIGRGRCGWACGRACGRAARTGRP